VKTCPRVVPLNVLADVARPAGDSDLEPGGVSVEAYREAADGFDLRYGKLASDRERGSSMVCLCLGSFIVDAAIGGDDSESVGDP